MKKQIALFLTLIMLLSLAACGNKSDADNKNDKDTAAAEGTENGENDEDGDETAEMISFAGVSLRKPKGFSITESDKYHLTAQSPDGSNIGMEDGQRTVESLFQYVEATNVEDYIQAFADRASATVKYAKDTQLDGHRMISGAYERTDGSGAAVETHHLIIIDMSTEETGERVVILVTTAYTAEDSAEVDAALQTLKIEK